MSIRGEIPEGAKVLNSILPQWRKKVKAKTLKMADVDSCLLTQIFGSYNEGLKLINIKLHDCFEQISLREERDLGFAPNEDKYEEDTYNILTEEWKEFLK